MINGIALANRFLEGEDDLDPAREIARLTTTPHPGVELESEANHWNVWNVFRAGRFKLGTIYFDSMEDAPWETMDAKAIQFWETHRWAAIPSMPRQEAKFFATFDEALTFLAQRARHAAQEALDPDNPDQYVNPERSTNISLPDAFEAAIRAMLEPYYPSITIKKHPNKFAHVFKTDLRRNWLDWIIICKRDTALPLADRNRSYSIYRQAVNWRAQIKTWFAEIAERHGVYLDHFEISGRLRFDPVFTFETHDLTMTGPYGPASRLESQDPDDPATVFNSITGKLNWPTALAQALTQAYPYGVNFSVTGGHSNGNVAAWTHYPAERTHALAEDVQKFVAKWIEDNQITPIKSIQLTKWDESKEGYVPYTGFNVWINIPFDVNQLNADDA